MLTRDGGIIKLTLQEGTGEFPQNGQEVTFNYEACLEDGKVFDRSADYGEPLKVTLGKNQVIPGMEIGVMSMKLGEKAKVTIQSKYGYGDEG